MREIDYFDASGCGPVGYALARREEARSLRDACCFGAPAMASPLLGMVDRIAENWLSRTPSPYGAEIDVIARESRLRGVHAINMGYQFACTTGVAADGDRPPLMRRVLDWALPGLGAGVAVVRQRGPAGDFLNVTWPGAVGVLTAMAPGRFSAAINQAPLYRRSASDLLMPVDVLLNLRNTLAREHGWPPDHLLRHVFETAIDFNAAIERLEREPLARPALFSIAGIKPGESALIERTEREARVYRGAFAVANAWREVRPGWVPRAWPGVEPIANNRARVAAMQHANQAGDRDLEWLQRPILNRLTRVAAEMRAADADLVVRGHEGRFRDAVASPATLIFDIKRAVGDRLAA